MKAKRPKRKRRPNTPPSSPFDPAECDKIKAIVDAAVTKHCPKSKVLGPVLKLFIYMNVPTSSANRIALSASATNELLDAIVPEELAASLSRLAPKKAWRSQARYATINNGQSPGNGTCPPVSLPRLFYFFSDCLFPPLG